MSDRRPSAYPARPVVDALPAAPALVLVDALPSNEASALLDYAIANEAMFCEAQTLSSQLEFHVGRHRSARTLTQNGAHGDIIASIAIKHEEAIRSRFGEKILAAVVKECELAASGDGDWFGPHRDNGAAPVASRAYTIVLYLHRYPRRFSGGELTLYGIQDRARQHFGPVQTITPSHNVAAIFPSSTLHEVLPVTLPTWRFADRRFALTCWI